MFSMIHLGTGNKRSLFGVPLADLFHDEPHHGEFEIPLFLATIILFIDSHGNLLLYLSPLLLSLFPISRHIISPFIHPSCTSLYYSIAKYCR